MVDCFLRAALAVALLACGASSALAQSGTTALLRQPALSHNHIAFVHAGDIWIADRDGQHLVQLTSHPAAESSPQFSPDGKSIAFSANYDNNTDVYVMPVSGGQPRRLTWHPGQDMVRGWSADGKRVLFSSAREIANNRSTQLFEVSIDGGIEKRVMQAVAYEGNWSSDGRYLAYRPYRQAYNGSSGWRQHRGGTTTPIWIIDPVANLVEKIPHVNATDSNPVWAGDDVIFISDRSDNAANLFAYNRITKAVRQLTRETVWDVRSANAYGKTVVYEAGGQVKLLDLGSGAVKPLAISIAAQSYQTRVQWKDASKTITSVALSPTGKRVVLSARGDIFTVPIKDGSTRNLTGTSGIREKDALWSADGKTIAYLAEAGMQHVLVLRDQTGLEKPRVQALGKPGYFHLLAWSPDGKTVVLHDNHLNLYSMGVERGALTLIDTTARRGSFNVSFSDDSRWLAYTVTGENHFGQIKLHDFATRKNTALTDGSSHADYPAFAATDYLYFMASINSGPSRVGLDMSTQEVAVRGGLYVAVLAANGKSPVLPKTSEEAAKDAKEKEEKDKDKKDSPDNPDNKDDLNNQLPDDDTKGARPRGEDGTKTKDVAATAAAKERDARAPDPDRVKPPTKAVRIDLDGLQGRIVALPLAERNYDSLTVAADGSLFYLEHKQRGSSNEPPGVERLDDGELYRYSFEERKAKSLKTGIASYNMSADRKKLLFQYARGRLEIADAIEKLDVKPVDLSQVRMQVNPIEEWEQIFNETWWMEKEFFYDPKLHGIDWDAIYARYHPLVKLVQRREDLNELLVEMIGELQVGHNRVGGGDVYSEPTVAVGLLGADYALERGHYRIKTLFRGDLWNPFMKAPLAAPGLDVREGDFIVAINGRALDAGLNIHSQLGNMVGRQVTITVTADPSTGVRRNVVVEPIANESALRRWQWIEANRLYVQQKTGGKVAYIYLPNTADEGFQFFNRMFFAQSDKQAIIIDERRNGGGQAANYITDVLNRRYLASWKDRDGLLFDTPGGAIYGPKVMLIDQDAGSGGDFLPYAFKRLGLGTLVGKRTWGGLIGISTNPDLIDGGNLSVPYFRFFTPEGKWAIENEGVAPDMEVELEPDQVNRGHDSQLDAGIARVLKDLEQYRPVQQRSAPVMPTKPGT